MLRKRPPPGEHCDFCSAPLAPEHSHLIELAARRIRLRLPALLHRLRTARRRSRALPSDSRALSRARGIRHSKMRTWDALADSDRSSLPLLQLAGKEDGRLLSQSGRRDRIVAPARYLGRDRGGQPPSVDVESRRRSDPNTTLPQSGRAALSCRSTPPTSWSARSGARGKASTAARRRTGALASSSTRSRNGRAAA